MEMETEYKLEEILPNMDSTNDELNSPITGEEIKHCIIKMNTNKSPGNDCIINEYITFTCDIVLPIYVTLFNIIFDTGIIPTVWLDGNVIPIYKKERWSAWSEKLPTKCIVKLFG